MSSKAKVTSRKRTEKLLRFQFDVDPGQREAYDLLMSNCGARTRAELFNNAVTLLEWAVLEVQKGRMIGSFAQDRTDTQPVILPLLQSAARQATVRPKRALADAIVAPPEGRASKRRQMDHVAAS